MAGPDREDGFCVEVWEGLTVVVVVMMAAAAVEDDEEEEEEEEETGGGTLFVGFETADLGRGGGERVRVECLVERAGERERERCRSGRRGGGSSGVGLAVVKELLGFIV